MHLLDIKLLLDFMSRSIGELDPIEGNWENDVLKREPPRFGVAGIGQFGPVIDLFLMVFALPNHSCRRS